MEEVKYHKIWASIYISFGILFTLIFILGFVLFQNYSNLLYIVCGIFLVVLGFYMRNQPYLQYSDNTIIVLSLFGSPRHTYEFNKKSEISVSGNRLLYNGKKVKANEMMVRKEDWRRLLSFYEKEEEALMTELQD